MAKTGKTLDSLRPSRFDTERLALALGLSLLAHAIVFGGYEFSKALHLFPWLHLLPKKMALVSPQNHEQPLQFVMVNQPSAKAPDKTKYYGAQNSRAANPEAKRETKVPQINGKQTKVLKTEAVTKPDFNQLQPTPQPAKPESPPPRPTLTPGELTLANPKDFQPQQPKPVERPRRLAQVQPRRLPGLQMRLDGGVHQIALQSSLNVKASLFGAYDAQFIEAVSQRWYDLLESRQFALDRTGKVVLRFHLNYDGTITDMTVLQNTVGELLGLVCEDAVNDPAPYARWPESMRQTVGANYRQITFTFYYY